MAYESMICDMIKVPGHNGGDLKSPSLYGAAHGAGAIPLRGADPPLAGWMSSIAKPHAASRIMATWRLATTFMSASAKAMRRTCAAEPRGRRRRVRRPDGRACRARFNGMRAQHFCNGKVGVIGSCSGGRGLSFMHARAAVSMPASTFGADALYEAEDDRPGKNRYNRST